jgi:hypothetical protein
MNRLEIDEHLTETKRKITAQKEVVTSLETQLLDVAARGDAKEVVAMKKEQTAAAELLGGLELVLKSFQSKSKDFTEKLEPEAAKIRKRLADELWPSALAEYDKLEALTVELQPIVEKITQLNNEMAVLTKQHERLIGDKIYTPRIPILEVWYVAANTKLDSLPKSLDIRLPAEREIGRQDRLKQEHHGSAGAERGRFS